MDELVKKVEQWHYDRNLIDGATDKDQVLKLLQELEFMNIIKHIN